MHEPRRAPRVTNAGERTCIFSLKKTCAPARPFRFVPPQSRRVRHAFCVPRRRTKRGNGAGADAARPRRTLPLLSRGRPGRSRGREALARGRFARGGGLRPRAGGTRPGVGVVAGGGVKCESGSAPARGGGGGSVFLARLLGWICGESVFWERVCGVFVGGPLGGVRRCWDVGKAEGLALLLEVC